MGGGGVDWFPFSFSKLEYLKAADKGLPAGLRGFEGR